ncbi:MAG TPA: 16S rRNA (adenine(1518)-N(6)/adenine(1519)-N(6))-dimethyltransferase RsmA [Acidiferrobacterales bacterium]
MTGPRPRKRFGQHFLHDGAAIGRIVAALAARPGDTLVEIGPGRGALTRPLLTAAGRLHAVELDRDLAAALPRACAGLGDLQVHQADALGFDFCKLAPEGGRLRLVGNLPYNISTPLLFRLLDQAACIEDMLFMLQREVVDRLRAASGGRDYGRLSVMVQWRCRVEKLFDVAPGAFTPPPKVESSVVRLTPHPAPTPAVRDPARFAQIVKAAFAQRRKTLRNTLKGLVSPDTLLAAGIDPGRRAETLSLAEFAALSDATAA